MDPRPLTRETSEGVEVKDLPTDAASLSPRQALQREATRGVGPLGISSHQVRPQEFYFRVNWDHLVKQEVFTKQCNFDKDYLDSLFNSANVRTFLEKASASLDRASQATPSEPSSSKTSSRPQDVWQTLFQVLVKKGGYFTLTDKRTLADDASNIHGVWTSCPDLEAPWTARSEESLAKFLNGLAEGIQKYVQVPIRRSWTAKYSTSCVFGHGAQRKPDLVLLDSSTSPGLASHGSWRVVRTVGEMKSSSKTSAWKEMMEQLSGKAAIMWGSQDGRDAVVTVGFVRSRFQLFIYDRGGVTATAQVPVHDNPIQFLKFVVAMAFGEDTAIGYSPTLTQEIGIGPRWITMQLPLDHSPSPEMFTVINIIYLSDSLIGRGSTLWQVKDTFNDRDYVIKDTWHDPRREYTDGEILQILGDDIDGIPIFVEECVVGDRANASTSGRRAYRSFDHVLSLLRNGKYDERVHLRLRIRPPRNAHKTGVVARPIYRFNSREELIVTLIDCIKAHLAAFKKGVLHCDITLTNLLIFLDVSNKSAGVLNDWGFAFVDPKAKLPAIKGPTPWPKTLPFQRGSGREDTLHRTGSLTFMALDLLYDPSVANDSRNPQSRPPIRKHEVHHDLESFFYVLLVICTLFKGPGDHCSMEEMKDMSFSDWWTPQNYQKAAEFKANAFTGGLSFFARNILSKLTSYFRPLIPPIIQLFTAIFSHMLIEDPDDPAGLNFKVVNTQPITHEVMLQHMEQILLVAQAADNSDRRKAAVPLSLHPSPRGDEYPTDIEADPNESWGGTHSKIPTSSDPPTSISTSVRTAGLGATELLPDEQDRVDLKLELAEGAIESPLTLFPSQHVRYTPILHMPLGTNFSLFAPSTDVPYPVFPDMLPNLDDVEHDADIQSVSPSKMSRVSGPSRRVEDPSSASGPTRRSSKGGKGETPTSSGRGQKRRSRSGATSGRPRKQVKEEKNVTILAFPE